MRFELNNDQREYLGLDPILPEWEKVALKGDTYREESILYFEGSIIKRYIISTNNEYKETQYNEATRDRLFLLPKTNRGKERKLTASTLESVKPVGVYFYLSSYGCLVIANHTTQTTFYSSAWHQEQSKVILDYEHIINDFIDNSPATHLQEINKFKHTVKKLQKFKEGDIFSFKIGREEYSFGQILMDIDRLKKKNLLPENHGLRYIMAMPILVKFYQYISKAPEIDVDSLRDFATLPSDYMMDNLLLYGEYKILGHLPLNEEDFDFPISYGGELDLLNENVFLQWGLISKTLPKKVFNKFTSAENHLVPETSSSRIMSNPFSYYSIGFRPCYTGIDIRNAILNASFDFGMVDHYKAQFDLRNPKNKAIRDEIFIQFGLDPSKNYAENCKMLNIPPCCVRIAKR